MTRTDMHGVTHGTREISERDRDTLYRPIVAAAANARREQEQIAATFGAAGLSIRPVGVDEFDEPDVCFVCNPFVWISRDKLDPEPRPVTCIDCLAVKED